MALFPSNAPRMSVMPAAPNVSPILQVGQTNAALEGVKLGNEIANTVRGLEKHKLEVEEAKLRAKALDLEFQKAQRDMQERFSPEAIQQRAKQAQAATDLATAQAAETQDKLRAVDGARRQALGALAETPEEAALLADETVQLSPSRVAVADNLLAAVRLSQAKALETFKTDEDIRKQEAGRAPAKPATVAVDVVEGGEKKTRWFPVDPATGAPDMSAGPLAEAKTGVTDERSNLTQSQAAMVQTLGALPGTIGAIAEAWNGIVTTPVLGGALNLAARAGLATEDRAKFLSERGMALFDLARAIQGAGVLTEQDIKRMESQIPKGSETEAAAVGALRGVVRRFIDAGKSWRRINGGKATASELEAVDSAIAELEKLDVGSLIRGTPGATKTSSKAPALEPAMDAWLKTTLGKK